MKFLLAFLIMFMGVLAQATYIPTAPTLTIGGRVFTDLTNLKILYCAGATGTPRSACREANGTAGYLPSGSNKFRILAMVISGGTAGVSNTTVSYGDNDVGFLSNTAVTNQVFLAGTSNSYMVMGQLGGRYGFNEIAINFLVLNGKYTIIETGVAGDIRFTVYGYEEP